MGEIVVLNWYKKKKQEVCNIPVDLEFIIEQNKEKKLKEEQDRRKRNKKVLTTFGIQT